MSALVIQTDGVSSVSTTPERFVEVDVPPVGMTTGEALDLSGAITGAAAHLAEAEAA
jgi:hypothetical protein